MKSIIKVLIVSIIAFVFNACGESDSNYVYDSNYVQPTPTNEQISGIVVDGYIENATVCLDIDNDAVCDSTEQSSTTASNGSFGFDKPSLFENSLVTILAYGGTDTSTDKSFHETFQTILETSTLDENETYIMSPLTDLVAHYYNLYDGNGAAALSDAKSAIASLLGITEEQIDTDPMKNIDIFAISQDLQHTKLLIQKLMEKHMSTLSDTQLQDLQNKIKVEVIEQNLNVERMIIALEIKLSLSLPNNEVEFVIAQAQELRNTLNSLSKDTSLSVDNLNRLQMSLDIKQDEVHNLLNDANESSTLEVIPIDITTESLTQTIFNTTNAELDEGACTTDNGYNYQVSYGFEAPGAMTEDSNNGIAIKTRLELGESVDDAKVTMYYPSLQNTETADMVVVFEEDYYFTFDEAWLDNSNKTIYIMTPKDDRGLYNCYRYELDSSSASNISATKVFRYTEL